MTIQVSYVSDILCVWAYVAEVRLDELRKEYGSSVELEYRFIPIFGATRHRIGEGWKKRGWQWNGCCAWWHCPMSSTPRRTRCR